MGVKVVFANVSSLCLCRETWGCEPSKADPFAVVLNLPHVVPNTVPHVVVVPQPSNYFVETL